jgi:hypothetical protein
LKGKRKMGETGNGNQSSHPDEGRAVESLSAEEARAEWEGIVLDKEGKYKNWPNSLRLGRQNKLFEKGFSAKIEEDRQTQEAKNAEWLERENRKIAERDEREEMGKARGALVQYFGGEKQADAAIKSAKSIFKRFATKEDIIFVDKSGLGNDPEFIQKLAEIGDILKRGGQKRR